MEAYPSGVGEGTGQDQEEGIDKMKMWVCENEECGWTGRKLATMSAGFISVKVCPNCLKSKVHQEEAIKNEK
jgi:hypothetical protein